MKKILPISLLTIALAILFTFWKKTPTQVNNSKKSSAELIKERSNFPTPTEIGGIDGDESMAEEAESQAKREAWIEMMHSAEPGTNWRAIEARTRYNRHQKRVAAKKSTQTRDDELLADGNLFGEWVERGSKNQAGRIVATDYVSELDKIFMISDGGSLFKGDKDGSSWEVVNDDLRFNDGFLKHFNHNGSRRWIAFIEDTPYYSDDDGLSWTESFGIFYTETNGGFHSPVILDDSLNTIYVLKKSSYWDDIELFRSTTQGEIFVKIASFPTPSFNELRLVSPHHSDFAYLARRGSSNGEISIFKIEGSQINLVKETGIDLGTQPINFTATIFDSDTILYTHDKDMVTYSSNDAGQTWIEKNTIPDKPWAVGIYVLKSNPNILYAGSNECYISTNGGSSWSKVADWWEYYDDVEFKIHADMMSFNEFENANSDPFLLIGNDGGISINHNDYSDFQQGYQNIGLENLNVSQYYDVRSDLDPSHYYIYAGSQDQGFQRAFTNFSNEGILEFEQAISGDYGHISFSLNGERMWNVYPGGWCTYYFNPQSGGVIASFDIDSEDESVWIPPMMDAPNMDDDLVYVAGGSAVTDGSGSFLIKLEYIAGEIIATNLPYDFKANGAGVLSAIASSKLNFERFYVATNNGSFFKSDDAGMTWTEGNQNVPNGHYLYGQTILPSKIDEETVYLGGSGYSNPGILKSTDGGLNFVDMSNGLPQTMVFDLAANADESLIFAATEAGPFVYVVTEDLWYDMSGLYAPAQTYWSVEFLEEDNLVRYGTYGRGIWDFQIKEEVGNNNITKAKFEFKTYPNPSNGIINLEWNDSENGNVNAQLYDLSGKLVFEKTLNSNASANTSTSKEVLNLSQLNVGNYFLKIESDQKVGTEKIILQK
ncbi:MAG: T9SS type A sorting domain-containing protein [Saprospiraceae bacterium]